MEHGRFPTRIRITNLPGSAGILAGLLVWTPIAGKMRRS